MTSLIKNFIGNDVAIIIMIVLAFTFEIHENLDKQIVLYHRIEQTSTGLSSYRGDSFVNVIGDLLCNFIGIAIGYQTNSFVTIVILTILFITITKNLGLEYWDDFFKFLSQFPK